MSRIDPSAAANPFTIDGLVSPPARSALAILDAERSDLDRVLVDRLLARARAALEADPELATVYGRKVALHDLERAAAELERPEGRALAELLDFPHHEVRIDDVGAIESALEERETQLREEPAPPLANLELLARLLISRLGDAPSFEVPELSIEAEPAPSAREVLGGLFGLAED